MGWRRARQSLREKLSNGRNFLVAWQKKPDLALKHGTEVTDIITSRVEIKYAYSPFKSPPVESFRANWNLAVS